MDAAYTMDRSPSRGLRAYLRAVRTLVDLGLGLAALFILVDLSVVGLGVVMRYFFDSPFQWTDEVVSLSLTAVSMLAAPKVLMDNGHIGVDILTGALRGRASLAVRIWSGCAVLCVSALLILNGWKTAMLSKLIGIVTEGNLELPVWMLQLLLPLGGLLLALVAIGQIWAALCAWRGAPLPEETSEC